MKKSCYNNINNLLKKRNKNIVNMDNKNIIKYNEEKNQQEKKDFQTNKNSIISNFNSNINKRQCQIKTTKGSPLSLNNKILKQISKIATKTVNQNIDKIPTVIFNINSNKILETNSKNIQNSNESKSNNKSKSKSNENNNFKKTSNQCNLIKRTIKKENNINGRINKTKTQTQKIQIKKSNNNLQKNIINKNQIKDNNSYKTNNPYHFYYNNIQKLNIGASLSLTSNKNSLAGMKYINNLINKNNSNNFRTTPITTKNSIKNSKEKNMINSNTNHKNDKNNENKKSNINGKIICLGQKKKISQQKLKIQNNNNLKSLMKKFSISNINKNTKNDIKKNNENISNSKNITLLGKNSQSSLSSLNNFYSINILSKSFVNSKKNFKKNINFYKTKVDTKIQSNEFQKKSNKYFDINNHNIFPITISHYKNNYININININKKKNNIKTSNNICNINKIVKNNSKNNHQNKDSKIKLNDLSKIKYK